MQKGGSGGKPQKVAILDAGAQYGKLIDRRVRELAVVRALPSAILSSIYCLDRRVDCTLSVIDTPPKCVQHRYVHRFGVDPGRGRLVRETHRPLAVVCALPSLVLSSVYDLGRRVETEIYHPECIQH